MNKHPKTSDDIFNLASRLDTALSTAQWVWTAITVLFVSAGSTVTAFIAKADPVLGALGPIYWIGVGLLTALVSTVVIFLLRKSVLSRAQAELITRFEMPISGINPLADSFSDVIINVADLRLPLKQLHQNKHFKRCQFVGPAAIAIVGGTYNNTGFIECGDVLAMPAGTSLSGIVVLQNCVVDECTFIRTTIVCDQVSGRALSAVPGASVKGLADV